MAQPPLDPNIECDRVVSDLLSTFIASEEYNKFVDDACLRVLGKSTPELRSKVRLLLMTRLGL